MVIKTILGKIGMLFDILWDMFNMLQIIANIRNLIVSNREIHGRFVVPPCIVMLAEALNSIVYFKPLENEIIKQELIQISGYDSVGNYINDMGVLFLGIIVSLILILILSAIKVLSKKYEVVQKIVIAILNALMWSSVIRFILQGYFQMALSSVYLVSTPSVQNDIPNYVKISLTFALPIIAWFFSNIYLERFKEEEFA